VETQKKICRIRWPEPNPLITFSITDWISVYIACPHLTTNFQSGHNPTFRDESKNVFARIFHDGIIDWILFSLISFFVSVRVKGRWLSGIRIDFKQVNGDRRPSLFADKFVRAVARTLGWVVSAVTKTSGWVVLAEAKTYEMIEHLKYSLWECIKNWDHWLGCRTQ